MYPLLSDTIRFIFTLLCLSPTTLTASPGSHRSMLTRSARAYASFTVFEMNRIVISNVSHSPS